MQNIDLNQNHGGLVSNPSMLGNNINSTNNINRNTNNKGKTNTNNNNNRNNNNYTNNTNDNKIDTENKKIPVITTTVAKGLDSDLNYFLTLHARSKSDYDNNNNYKYNQYNKYNKVLTKKILVESDFTKSIQSSIDYNIRNNTNNDDNSNDTNNAIQNERSKKMYTLNNSLNVPSVNNKNATRHMSLTLESIDNQCIEGDNLLRTKSNSNEGMNEIIIENSSKSMNNSPKIVGKAITTPRSFMAQKSLRRSNHIRRISDETCNAYVSKHRMSIKFNNENNDITEDENIPSIVDYKNSSQISQNNSPNQSSSRKSSHSHSKSFPLTQFDYQSTIDEPLNISSLSELKNDQINLKDPSTFSTNNEKVLNLSFTPPSSSSLEKLTNSKQHSSFTPTWQKESTGNNYTINSTTPPDNSLDLDPYYIPPHFNYSNVSGNNSHSDSSQKNQSLLNTKKSLPVSLGTFSLKTADIDFSSSNLNKINSPISPTNTSSPLLHTPPEMLKPKLSSPLKTFHSNSSSNNDGNEKSEDYSPYYTYKPVSPSPAPKTSQTTSSPENSKTSKNMSFAKNINKSHQNLQNDLRIKNDNKQKHSKSSPRREKIPNLKIIDSNETEFPKTPIETVPNILFIDPNKPLPPKPSPSSSPSSFSSSSPKMFAGFSKFDKRIPGLKSPKSPKTLEFPSPLTSNFQGSDKTPNDNSSNVASPKSLKRSGSIGRFFSSASLARKNSISSMKSQNSLGGQTSPKNSSFRKDESSFVSISYNDVGAGQAPRKDSPRGLSNSALNGSNLDSSVCGSSYNFFEDEPSSAYSFNAINHSPISLPPQQQNLKGQYSSSASSPMSQNRQYTKGSSPTYSPLRYDSAGEKSSYFFTGMPLASPTLSSWNQLLKLDLSRTAITTLPESIAECRSLTQLIANNCKLTRISNWVSENLLNLQALVVRGNDIKTWPAHLARLYPSLEVVDMEENPVWRRAPMDFKLEYFGNGNETSLADLIGSSSSSNKASPGTHNSKYGLTNELGSFSSSAYFDGKYSGSPLDPPPSYNSGGFFGSHNSVPELPSTPKDISSSDSRLNTNSRSKFLFPSGFKRTVFSAFSPPKRTPVKSPNFAESPGSPNSVHSNSSSSSFATLPSYNNPLYYSPKNASSFAKRAVAKSVTNGSTSFPSVSLNNATSVSSPSSSTIIGSDNASIMSNNTLNGNGVADSLIFDPEFYRRTAVLMAFFRDMWELYTGVCPVHPEFDIFSIASKENTHGSSINSENGIPGIIKSSMESTKSEILESTTDSDKNDPEESSFANPLKLSLPSDNNLLQFKSSFSTKSMNTFPKSPSKKEIPEMGRSNSQFVFARVLEETSIVNTISTDSIKQILHVLEEILNTEFTYVHALRELKSIYIEPGEQYHFKILSLPKGQSSTSTNNLAESNLTSSPKSEHKSSKGNHHHHHSKANLRASHLRRKSDESLHISKNKHSSKLTSNSVSNEGDVTRSSRSRSSSNNGIFSSSTAKSRNRSRSRAREARNSIVPPPSSSELSVVFDTIKPVINYHSNKFLPRLASALNQLQAIEERVNGLEDCPEMIESEDDDEDKDDVLSSGDSVESSKVNCGNSNCRARVSRKKRTNKKLAIQVLQIAEQVAIVFMDSAKPAMAEIYNKYVQNLDNGLKTVDKWEKNPRINKWISTARSKAITAEDSSEDDQNNNTSKTRNSTADYNMSHRNEFKTGSELEGKHYKGSTVGSSNRNSTGTGPSQINLSAYLLLPLQRVTRYRLLLNQITYASEALKCAYGLISEITEEMNSVQRQVEGRNKLEQIQTEYSSKDSGGSLTLIKYVPPTRNKLSLFSSIDEDLYHTSDSSALSSMKMKADTILGGKISKAPHHSKFFDGFDFGGSYVLQNYRDDAIFDVVGIFTMTTDSSLSNVGGISGNQFSNNKTKSDDSMSPSLSNSSDKFSGYFTDSLKQAEPLTTLDSSRNSVSLDSERHESISSIDFMNLTCPLGGNTVGCIGPSKMRFKSCGTALNPMWVSLHGRNQGMRATSISSVATNNSNASMIFRNGKSGGEVGGMGLGSSGLNRAAAKWRMRVVVCDEVIILLNEDKKKVIAQITRRESGEKSSQSLSGHVSVTSEWQFNKSLEETDSSSCSPQMKEKQDRGKKNYVQSVGDKFHQQQQQPLLPAFQSQATPNMQHLRLVYYFPLDMLKNNNSNMNKMPFLSGLFSIGVHPGEHVVFHLEHSSGFVAKRFADAVNQD